MNIPTGDRREIITTRNTKEAALLYALAECPPHLTDGKPSARWQQENGERVFWLFFENTKLATTIHAAINDRDYEAKHEGAQIPDEHMPAVIALFKRWMHNFERLREVIDQGPTSALPLHYLIQSGTKLYLTTKPAEAK